MSDKGKAIAVFAYNIADKILPCLNSIKLGIEPDTDQCFVLVNGCTDKTANVVAAFCQENAFCQLVEISLGDKANAWNVFIHTLAPDADAYFCVDGDCEFFPDSFKQLQQCLREHPTINIAAAIPMDCGRNSRQIAKDMLMNGGVAGNLYAMSKTFVERLRSQSVYLPTGWIGDDSLIGALAYWDLNPKGPWDRTRIQICEKAKYGYKSLSPLNPRDYYLYFRRRVRYSLRQFQTNALKTLLTEQGLAAIPRHVDDLYHSDTIRLKWRGLDTWFDYLAIQLIKRRMNAQGR